MEQMIQLDGVAMLNEYISEQVSSKLVWVRTNSRKLHIPVLSKIIARLETPMLENPWEDAYSRSANWLNASVSYLYATKDAS